MIRLYKDGDSFAFETDSDSWDVFVDEASNLLEKLIESGDFADDWHFQFRMGIIPLLITAHSYYTASSTVQVKNFIRIGESAKLPLIIQL